MDEKSKTLYSVKKGGRKFNVEELKFLEDHFIEIKTEVDLNDLVIKFNRNKNWVNVRKISVETHYNLWKKNLEICKFILNYIIYFSNRKALNPSAAP